MNARCKWLYYSNIFYLGLMTSVSYSETIGIHVEFFVVQPAQRSVCLFEVVHVLHRFAQCLQQHLAMGCYFGIIQNSSGSEDITKRTEIPFGPGVDDQNSVNVRGQGYFEFQIQGFCTFLIESLRWPYPFGDQHQIDHVCFRGCSRIIFPQT